MTATKTAPADHPDAAVSRIANAIGEPARARMLYSLMDGHARSSTELAVLSEVTPSTASAHLSRLVAEGLMTARKQGKHRYYALSGSDVADALEALSVLAGGAKATFVPNTPVYLRTARTCYDHIAGTLGVALHDRMHALGWITTAPKETYEVTPGGTKALEGLGVNVNETRALRRRFAYPCLDWSERRPHIGGAVGAAILGVALKRKWVTRELDSRVLTITRVGEREMNARLGVQL